MKLIDFISDGIGDYNFIMLKLFPFIFEVSSSSYEITVRITFIAISLSFTIDKDLRF
tara:strand:+ start:186 stop:356 length:171 start_codon:yes stop_codon:yes gene_type:complete